MPGDFAAWTAIALVAAVTLTSRLAGAFLMTRIHHSAAVERFLDGLSVSVLAALVGSALAQHGWREAAAVALAALVMMRAGSAVWALTAGIALAAGWTAAFG